jgi:hypothetical protein
MAKQKQKLQVKIVLDTNAIWTGGESYLLRQEIADLVDANQGDIHLEIEWILPEVVLARAATSNAPRGDCAPTKPCPT